MGTCKYCDRTAITISDVIGFCAECIRDRFAELWPRIKALHDESRRSHGLPCDPPQAENGIGCPLCFHKCKIPEHGKGYCGVRGVERGKLKGGHSREGNLAYYHDPLPTNCVADFVCPAGGHVGYPQYSVCAGREFGYKNLAVFYHACSFNCLYCQNYHFKYETFSPTVVTAEQLAEAADEKTTCICYFGGDPSPQILHALKKMAELSLVSGGCIKFDLKAWHDSVHHALCGVSNESTLMNFSRLSRLISRRPKPPFLVASTLLVPGYVDVEEVTPIARFLAELNPRIPYRLLAFHPEYCLKDLPRTSRRHAIRCREAAERAGLERVAVGNYTLLGDSYR